MPSTLPLAEILPVISRVCAKVSDEKNKTKTIKACCM
jgi:hypothetical protein